MNDIKQTKDTGLPSQRLINDVILNSFCLQDIKSIIMVYANLAEEFGNIPYGFDCCKWINLFEQYISENYQDVKEGK